MSVSVTLSFWSVISSGVAAPDSASTYSSSSVASPSAHGSVSSAPSSVAKMCDSDSVVNSSSNLSTSEFGSLTAVNAERPSCARLVSASLALWLLLPDGRGVLQEGPGEGRSKCFLSALDLILGAFLGTV